MLPIVIQELCWLLCVCRHSFKNVSLCIVMAYLEFLVMNGVSVNISANNISAIKANLVMYSLEHAFLDHPKSRYFLKSMKMSRPLSVIDRPIMTIDILHAFISAFNFVPFGKLYAAVFLIAYFGFLRISNLAPHAHKEFDPSRHLTPSDVIFSKHFMSLSLKWSKTKQFRDKIQTITLPRLRHSILYPVRALKAVMAIYNPGPNDPLFQIYSAGR